MHARVYTYAQTASTYGQPNNDEAWGIGKACRKAADDPKCGDYIDRGLILLRELQELGYGIVRLTDSASVQEDVGQ